MTEAAGIEEAAEETARSALLIAAQVAEQIARRAEERARVDERAAEQAAQAARARFEAERDTARAEVGPAAGRQWWDTAELDDAARVYAVAQAWAPHDPDLASAADAITERIEARFGSQARESVEPGVSAALGHGPGSGTGASSGTGTGRDEAGAGTDGERVRAAGVDLDVALAVAHDAQLSVAGAAAARAGTGRAAAQEGGAAEGWDSPRRREALAASLAHVADPEGVDARLRLDRARATPGIAATGAPAVLPAAKTPAVAPARQVEIGR